MPFREYLELVKKDPLIAQTSLSRIWEMIQDAGTQEIAPQDRWFFGQDVDRTYNFFTEELFGIEGAVFGAVNYIRAAANKGSTGKQMLLLVGPPASGKSTFVESTVRGLENYRKRPVFMIQGCPKFEEPLHLLPRHLRKDAAKNPNDCPDYPQCEKEGKHLHLGVKIDGDLCPLCRNTLLTKYKDSEAEIVKWWDVPVETFTFSIQGRRGFGSFAPTGEKASDVTALTGHENIGITSNPKYGHDHHLAFTLTGEIPKSERGIIEGEEMLACEEDVLGIFFSIGEERRIKIQGSSFPRISVDTLVIGHINLTPFKEFSAKKKYEGLHNRFIVVPVPYPLKIREEVKIYKKLIERDSDFVKLRKCHIAPGTFEIAALFAVMTRYTPSQTGIDLLTKAKIYNGDMALTEIEHKEKNPIDARQLAEEGRSDPDIAKREGMFGISSRTALAALNSAIVKQLDKNGCLTPLKAIWALYGIFDQTMGIPPENVEQFKTFLSSGESRESVMNEYRNFIVKAVRKAFSYGYKDLAKEYFSRYLEEIKLERFQKAQFVRGQVFEIKRDDITGKPKQPDLKFIRSIEVQEPFKWTEEQAQVARGEILLIAGEPGFNFETYRPLREASENKLIGDSKELLTAVLDMGNMGKPPGKEEGERRDDLFGALLKEGYCNVCANEAVKNARDFLGE